MRTRLDELPVFEIRQLTVRASDYNLVHIALKRLGEPLRLELPKLRTLDLVLEHDAWIVIDRALNDMPVLAWIDFEVIHRHSLHEPVPCQRRTYHTHALLIVDKVIEAMHLILGERLASLDAPEVEPVTRMKRPS